MADTKVDSEEEFLNASYEEDSEEEERKPTLAETKPDVAALLKQLQSSGALVRKPKVEYNCKTCKKDYPDWGTLENHLIQHVVLPWVVLDKLPSDSEPEFSDNEEDNWSEPEDQTDSVPETDSKPVVNEKPDISQLLKNSGITIKKNTNDLSPAKSAIDKLAGLGILKKKPEIEEQEKPKPVIESNDLMQKLGQIGGLKLKLKQTEGETFKVVNGKVEQDNDEDWSGDEDENDDMELEPEDLLGTADSVNETDKAEAVVKKPQTIVNANQTGATENQPAVKPSQTVVKSSSVTQSDSAENTPMLTKLALPIKEISNHTLAANNNKEKPIEKMEDPANVVVKQEIPEANKAEESIPLFNAPIKTERSSPPPSGRPTVTQPVTVKTEVDTVSTPSVSTPLFSTASSSSNGTATSSTVPNIEPKKEISADIIEINGDSNDEDDDCCVVSTTPATHPKVEPKVEEVVYPSAAPVPTYPVTSMSQPVNSLLANRLSSSTEKQHNFNWNAPEEKPAMELLEKSTGALFDDLFDSNKKQGYSSNVDTISEYVSLDSLGSQHTCEVCNTRFTSISMLESHKLSTGHSSSLIAPQSKSVLPAYSTPNSLFSSFLPVKQIAEQVGKLSTVHSNQNSPFTHQQNVMINIQSFPGPMGQPGMNQPYNPYAPPQGMQPPGQAPYQNQGMPQGQYAGGQYPQPPTSQQGYYHQQQQQYQPQPGQQASMYPQQQYPNQGYPPAPGVNNQGQWNQQQQPGQAYQPSNQMPPPPAPGSTFVPSSSPNAMNKQSGIRIQNVQSFNMRPPGPQNVRSPGAMGQQRPRQMGAMPRPGARPTLRPGLQVQGMRPKQPMKVPMKRPMPPGGPPPKKRPDVFLPGRHDNEDCQTMSIQKHRDGLPLISSIQGSKDKYNLGSQISVTKKTVNREATMVANALAARGISVKAKAKSRSPSPERPIPRIPGLGSDVSIKHTSRKTEDGFTIPEARVGAYTCKVCRRQFNSTSMLTIHMANVHSVYSCEDCPASYPKQAQLQHHRRVFHSDSGPDRELGLPVVDLSNTENVKRLADLGIYNFIPLANREQTGGCYGIPVVSSRNASAGLRSLGANGVLSLGPLKTLP